MTPEEGRPVPYTVAPRLRDPDAALRILEQHHPPLLKAAGVTGQVLIRDYVDSTGHVHRVEIVQGSGIEGLDRTALSFRRALRVHAGTQHGPACERLEPAADQLRDQAGRAAARGV